MLDLWLHTSRNFSADKVSELVLNLVFMLTGTFLTLAAENECASLRVFPWPAWNLRTPSQNLAICAFYPIEGRPYRSYPLQRNSLQQLVNFYSLPLTCPSVEGGATDLAEVLKKCELPSEAPSAQYDGELSGLVASSCCSAMVMYIWKNAGPYASKIDFSNRFRYFGISGRTKR